MAGLYVNEALLDMEQHEWESALELLERARKMYDELGDKDREVKLYDYRGDVLVEMGRLGEAKDTYREGLSVSKQHHGRMASLRTISGSHGWPLWRVSSLRQRGLLACCCNCPPAGP